MSVEVPIGNDYDVLFLAGHNRTLLAAGYLGVNNSTTGTYSNNDGPVDIVAGQANVFTINVTRIPLVWDHSNSTNFTDNDFLFKFGGSTVTVAPRHIPIVQPTGSEKFEVEFNVDKLEPLLLADQSITTPGTIANLTIADHTVRLLRRYSTPAANQFPAVILAPEAGISSSSGPYAYDPTTVSFSSTAFPQKDVDGLLQFELKYRAFGTEYSKGTVWVIRNGDGSSNRTADGDDSTNTGADSGALFVVKIGAGSPEVGETATVDTTF